MKIRNAAIVLMLGSAATFAGLTRAATPTTSTTKTDETTQLQHLRETRKDLNAAKVAFEKDPTDAANHRKEILEGIDKAIVAVDAEIVELKGK